MSKSSKKEMGQGIRALLSNIEKKEKDAQKGSTQKEYSTNKINTNYLEPNPYQPRKNFKEEDLEDLMQSIKIHGIIQPIAVRKLSDTAYQIISGERRWRAASSIGLNQIPVHILDADDQAMLEMALLENIQRSDLNPIEIAVSYQRLIDECDLTHEEVAERIGKKRSSISNYLRLLKLSPSVQDAVKAEKISLGHAKLLAGLDRVEMQTLFLGKILQGDLSVRATEQLLKTSKKSDIPQINQSSAINTEIQKIKKNISNHFGTKVQISRNQNGTGYIKIPFDSDDDFNDLVDTILE